MHLLQSCKALYDVKLDSQYEQTVVEHKRFQMALCNHFKAKQFQEMFIIPTVFYDCFGSECKVSMHQNNTTPNFGDKIHPSTLSDHLNIVYVCH